MQPAANVSGKGIHDSELAVIPRTLTWKRRFRATLRWVVLVLLLIPTPLQATLLPSPDKLELVRMLKDHRFKELDDFLSEYQHEFERDETNDYKINSALSAFATTDPEVGEPLNLWVEANPVSAIALCARAYYYQHLGRISRGEYFLSKTPRKRLEQMNRYFRLASADAERAIGLNPKATAAYQVLINISMVQGERTDRDLFAEVALGAAPNSDLIRYSYVASLHPWWGGSIEEIRAFISKSKSTLPSPVDGYPLDGYEHYVRGLVAVRNERRKEAMAHFNRALSFGEYVPYLLERAHNDLVLRHGDRGRADYERSLALSPQSPRVLTAYSLLLFISGERDEALKLRERALQFDPLNPRYLVLRARSLQEERRFRDAREDLDRAMIFGALDHWVRFERGLLNLEQLDERELAREDFEAATSIAPGHAKYWYYYAEALSQGPNSEAPECEAAAAFKRYLELCRNETDCYRERLALAEFYTEVRPELYGSC